MEKNEYRYKLHEMWKLPEDQKPFLEWIIDEVERNHKKQKQMAKDIARLLSDISELKSKI